MASRRITVGLVVVAIALGAFLRLYGLDEQSLWLDEIATVGPALFAESFSDAYWHHINLHPTPPLYTIFLMGWTALTGFSETWLRMPSALIGILTVIVFYRGLTRVFDENLSAVAAILMALSWPAIYYSQEIRAYSAVLLFTTWAAVVWMGVLKTLKSSTRIGRPDWLNLFAASVFASLTHPFGFIITGFLWLYLLIVVRDNRALAMRTIFTGLALIAVYLCWFIPNVFGLAEVISGKQIYFERPGLWFFVHIGAFLFHHPVVALLTCIIPLALGAIPYSKRLFSAVRGWDFTAPEIYLPFILAVPFMFSFSVAQVKPFMYSRHLIVFLPFIFTFFAYVLASRSWRHGVIQPVMVFILALISCFWIFRDYYVPDKPQNRELAQYALAAMDERTMLAVPCEAEVRFECRLGPGQPTNPRWSKYIYYLNRANLSDIRMIPQSFGSLEELAALVARSQALGRPRVVLMGSRGNVGAVENGIKFLENANYHCKTMEFHLALGSICEPARD